MCRLLRVQRRINKGFEVFEYYANNQWDFKNENVVQLRKIINERERRCFKIDGDELDLDIYITDCILAARQYILNEPLETLPAARRHMKIMYWVDVIAKLIFWGLLLWTLASCENHTRIYFEGINLQYVLERPTFRLTNTPTSGRTQDNNHCRRCHSEVETLAHVLGSCPFGEILRNSRHHKIRSVIATCLKSNGYTTYEEVHGIADTGSHRHIDIITFKPGETKGYILDPTIRFDIILMYRSTYDISMQIFCVIIQ
ncbi:hypothetical protein ANN_07381 [Periplaneta americana]|uniref:Fatty acyl-CoA reductase C-terminal domain-containing protein n=1 Tax=Periplaneta americana TaxID=6978 RepID=A0ABQ8SZV7_PERAM|nr:hypothetical protein ANN_07381 [Periplaneta americana]